MYKLYKWFLVIIAVVLLTACGGSSSSSESTQLLDTQTVSDESTQSLDPQTVAIDKIMLYANDNTQPAPTILDYSNAGIVGVTAENIDDINEIVESLTVEDVDSSEEIQALVDDLDIVLPEDSIPPVITLNAANPMTIIQGDAYTEPGATAVDNRDGSVSVTIIGGIDTNTVGTYTITYSAEDSARNSNSETRTVNVVLESTSDETPPVITLNGANPMTITEGDTYTEPGAIALDDRDGSVNVTISGSVDTNTVGTYTITYKAEDAAGNTASETRTVNVIVVPTGNAEWDFIPSVAQGTQFDAQVGPNNLIHLISSSYYQLDLSGNVIVDEEQGDEQQGLSSFPPAIAVGGDGSVHLVTRHNGDKTTGYDIRYRLRSAIGSWDVNYIVGTRVARNYVVGVSWTDTDIILSSTKMNSNDVYGDIYLWKAGTSSAAALGSLSGMWRADVDNRMRGQNGIVHLAAGKHSSSTSQVYYTQAEVGTGLRDRLNANKTIHQSGVTRRSFPDLALDGQNNTHFVYGARSEVYYNKYNASGQKIFGSDKRIFSNLGTWHLSIGLSGIAVSESGEFVVAVGLRTKGDQQAANSDILWTYSTDGGISWSTPQDTGKNSDAGEGRRRPRLVAVGDSFVLLFGDTIDSGISMGVLTFK